jgi:hypothetical protein
MNNIQKKEKELEKISMSFKELKDAFINTKIKSEYKQAGIIILRKIFSERQKNIQHSGNTEQN